MNLNDSQLFDFSIENTTTDSISKIKIPVRKFPNVNKKKFKGTIALILGGFLGIDKTDNKIVIGSKGYGKNTIREITPDEKIVIEELCSTGWQIIIFENMQFCKVDDKFVQNENWIDYYINWLVTKFSNNNSKVFVVGFSAGAYIVGLHLQHLNMNKKEDLLTGYGIFSYSVPINDEYNKTKFDKEHFKKSVLFVSGSNTRDIDSNYPFVNGYHNTRTLFEIAQNSNVKHGWISINSDHTIFAKKLPKKSNTDKEMHVITIIMDNWFHNDSKVLKSIGIDKVTNPDSNIKNHKSN